MFKYEARKPEFILGHHAMRITETQTCMFCI